MTPRDQITIGVELEMVIHNISEDTPQFSEFRLVAEALSPLATKIGAGVVDTGSDIEIEASEEESDRISASFHIQEDITIRVVRPYRSVEVATPILRHCQHRIVIPEMCEILKTTFDLGFNDTTGLHVHIGIGRPYTLQDLKRVSKAIILFEAAMDKHHPICRSNHVPAKYTTSCIESTRQNRVFKKLRDFDCMAVIDGVSSIEELLTKTNFKPNHTGYGKGCKYNITDIKGFGTVEFRQAAATDDADQIVDWIERVIAFARSAISTPDDDFSAWAIYGINPEIYQRFGVPIPEHL